MKTTESPGWRQRLLGASFWAILIGLFWTLDTLTKLDQQRRLGIETDHFRLITAQATSAVGVFVMVAFVAFWLRHFPLDRRRPLPTLVGHLVGSGLFTVGHYTVFVALRKLAYGLQGLDYMPGQRHFGNLIFEYKKDVKIYLAIVGILAAYRYIGDLRTGADASDEVAESQPPAEPAAYDEPTGPGKPTKLIVQTRRGERILAIDDIEYLEAARNYIVVHTDTRRFLVRSPLGQLLERLPEGLFVRTHRSFLVQVSKIVELQSVDSSYVLILRSEARVPVSRSYRDQVKALVEGMGI